MVIAAHNAIAHIGPGPTSSIPTSAQHQSRGRSQPPSKSKKRLSPDKEKPGVSQDPQLKSSNGMVSSSSWSFSAQPAPEVFYPELPMNYAQQPMNGARSTHVTPLNGLAGTSSSIPTNFPIPSGTAMDFDPSVQFNATYADNDVTMFTELLPQERSADWDFTSIFASDGRADASQPNGAFQDAFTWNFQNGRNMRS